MSYRDRICNLLYSYLAGRDLSLWKDWFIRIDMRVQLHCQNPCCIFEAGWPPLLLSWYNPLPAEPPFSSVHRDKKKCRIGTNSSSRKKGLAEPGSLTNTNIIEKNCLFCILPPVPLLPPALRNRSDHIDIPSTQHRSSKGSWTTHQSTKARIFQKIDSYLKSA